MKTKILQTVLLFHLILGVFGYNFLGHMSNPSNSEDPCEFDCGNGRCIALSRLCDGANDCHNMDDENNCHWNGASYGGKTNLCQKNQCSYRCVQNSTAHWCTCPGDLELDTDQLKCVDQNNYLLVSTGLHLYRFYSELKNSTSTFEPVAIPKNVVITDVAMSKARNEIYLHDSVTNRIGLLDMGRTQVHHQWHTLVDRGLRKVTALAFDPYLEVLFWIDRIKGTLEVVNPISRDRATLNSNLIQPISITIAFIKIERDPNPSRYRSLPDSYIMMSCTLIGQQEENSASIVILKLDGTFYKRVPSIKIGHPVALVFDFNMTQVIWADSFYEKIDSVELNGKVDSTKRKLVEGEQVHNITSLTSRWEQLFWTTSHPPSIFSNGKMNQWQLPNSTQDLDYTRLRIIYIPNLSVSYIKPRCECAHLCLTGTILQPPVCKCSDGYYTSDGGKTCIFPELKSEENDKDMKQTRTSINTTTTTTTTTNPVINSNNTLQFLTKNNFQYSSELTSEPTSEPETSHSLYIAVICILTIALLVLTVLHWQLHQTPLVLDTISRLNQFYESSRERVRPQQLFNVNDSERNSVNSQYFLNPSSSDT